MSDVLIVNHGKAEFRTAVVMEQKMVTPFILFPSSMYTNAISLDANLYAVPRYCPRYIIDGNMRIPFRDIFSSRNAHLQPARINYPKVLVLSTEHSQRGVGGAVGSTMP
jgi:hypothetical protein